MDSLALSGMLEPTTDLRSASLLSSSTPVVSVVAVGLGGCFFFLCFLMIRRLGIDQPAALAFFAIASHSCSSVGNVFYRWVSKPFFGQGHIDAV